MTGPFIKSKLSVLLSVIKQPESALGLFWDQDILPLHISPMTYINKAIDLREEEFSQKSLIWISSFFNTCFLLYLLDLVCVFLVHRHCYFCS